MTMGQVIAVLLLYSMALLAAVYFTRPTSRRLSGAAAGGVAAALVLLAAAAIGNAQAWWQTPILATPGFLLLFFLAAAVSCWPIYLITWRVAARFGARGLTVCLIVATIVGPPRDYLIAAVYPEWIVFTPGVAPVFADAVTYFAFVAIGHFVMRLVAGPAGKG